MAQLLEARPALPVRDIERSCRFYRDELAFILRHRESGFAIVCRDAVEIHLWLANDERWRERGIERPVVTGAESFLAGTASCRVRVAGIETLYEAIQPRGIVHNNAPLTRQPWGDLDFSVVDPDGNLVTFFQP
jgi:catechol 2,3-dioxygenase-like lactoylglutathione lyase family enzyme